MRAANARFSELAAIRRAGCGATTTSPALSLEATGGSEMSGVGTVLSGSGACGTFATTAGAALLLLRSACLGASDGSGVWAEFEGAASVETSLRESTAFGLGTIGACVTWAGAAAIVTGALC